MVNCREIKVLSIFFNKSNSRPKGVGGTVDDTLGSSNKTFFNSTEDMQNYYENWLQSLSENEVRALNQYSGSDYTLINNYLRGFSDDLGHVSPEVINDLKSALNKVELPQNITVYRGTDSLPFEAIADLNEVGNIDWDSLVGKTFTDDAFISTSIEQSSSFGHVGVTWEINLPEGTTGGMLNKVSQYPNEAEFLLNAGQELLIMGTEVDSLGNVKLIMELIQK